MLTKPSSMTRSLITLVHRSDAEYVTAADALKKDVLRWAAIAGLLMFVVYSIGLLVSGADTEDYPIHYYAQITFMNTPAVAIILMAFTCFVAAGYTRSVKFWLILSAMCIVWFGARWPIVNRIDPTSFGSAICVMVMFLSAWRLWEYIELRYIFKLDSPYLTRSAVAVYSLLFTVAAVLLFPT